MEPLTTRKLTADEICKLQEQGCSAENWDTIYVTDEASLKYIRGTRFSGDIRIGRFQKSFEMPGGMHKHSGIFHSTLHDVTIGDDCFLGPNVNIYTACHSTNPAERLTRQEWAKPVTIGNSVWIGGNVTILPGVTIGNNCTIGAGSVVTHDIPDNSIAVGNPAKVIKTINCQ